jgi:Protein of unknown function (DUF3306)
MSEPENFLARWSRRKTAETEREGAPDKSDAASSATDVGGAENIAADSPAASQSEKAPAEVDLASLPAIESIGIGTNVSAFLRTGVPAELTRAALRRAWAADPAIRDFVGLSENAWDFTAPDGIPGFGPLSGADATRAMAGFTGQTKEAVEQVVERIQTPAAEVAQPDAPVREFVAPPSERTEELTATHDDAGQPTQANASIQVQCKNENDAMQRERVAIVDSGSPVIRRGHGGALPQ